MKAGVGALRGMASAPNAARQPVIALDHVTRSFGHGQGKVTALHDVNLTVGAGEFVSIMGSSGSGKSTLLAIAGGLERPTKGQVHISGQSLGGLSRDDLARIRRRRLGFVFQELNLVPTLTAVENVCLPLELDGVSSSRARKAAMSVLEQFSMAQLADRFVDEMSGGERQRIAIARAVVGDRRVLLADEPTGALDSTSGDEVMSLIRDLADSGVAVLLVTHEARHAGWADRVVFLRDGVLVDETAAYSDPMDLLLQDDVADDIVDGAVPADDVTDIPDDGQAGLEAPDALPPDPFADLDDPFDPDDGPWT